MKTIVGGGEGGPAIQYIHRQYSSLRTLARDRGRPVVFSMTTTTMMMGSIKDISTNVLVSQRELGGYFDIDF